jgi:hypothetical protein
VLLNSGTAACGCVTTVKPITSTDSLVLSQGYGAQRLEAGGADAGSELIVDSLSVSARLNDSEVPHSGFSPYVQDGMSRHTVQLDGAATILFDYSERDGGVGS